MPVQKFKETFILSIRTSLDLFKIIIPVSILVKVLQETGFITVISELLSPAMALVGLPGVLAVVWATVMLANIYAGVVVFASLSAGLTLTVAQVSVLGGMILLAHSLPVEVSVARKAGVRVWFTLFLRIGGALVYGWLLFQLYSYTGWHSEEASVFFLDTPADPTIFQWILAEIERLFFVFVIILILHLVLDILKWAGITGFIIRHTRHLLSAFGMTEKAGPLVVVGMLLGLLYGGGLIISEAKQHTIDGREVFNALTLLALLHGVIEDTAVMMLIGGNLSGLLWGRLILTAIVALSLVRIVRALPEETFRRYLFVGVENDSAE